MSSLTRTIPLLGAALAPALLLAACNPLEEVACPLMKCSFQGDQGVRITLANALDRLSGDLPATITFCAENRCAEVTLRLAGKSFACISNDIRATCDLGDDGTLTIRYAVALPDTTEVPISLAVQGAGGDALFEEKKNAPIVSTRPGGMNCPQECREAEISFAAPQQPREPAQPERPPEPGEPAQPEQPPEPGEPQEREPAPGD